MKPTLPLLLAIALVQWLVLQLPHVETEYDTTTFLMGNLQMVIILGLYQVFNKYVHVSKD